MPRPADEGRHLVQLLEDLHRRAVVVGVGVRLVPVLVGHVVGGIALGHLERHRHGSVGALCTRRVDDLRAVHVEQLGALLRDVVGHHHLQRIALSPADHRQRDARVPGGGLEDRLPGTDQALLLGTLDHRPCHAVLDRAGRVVALELRVDPDAGLGGHALQLDERRVPDRLDDVAVPASARAVVEAGLEHCFRKCSASLLLREHGVLIGRRARRRTEAAADRTGVPDLVRDAGRDHDGAPGLTSRSS